MRLFVSTHSLPALLAIGLPLLGCGGESKAKIRIMPNVVAGTQTSAVRIGSPAATNLHSLKYYIMSIQLCQNVQGSGSGFSSAEGCIQLYQNPNAGGDYLRRFEREARTIGSLNHPNLLTLYDVGEHEGIPFLVTEMLDGE